MLTQGISTLGNSLKTKEKEKVKWFTMSNKDQAVPKCTEVIGRMIRNMEEELKSTMIVKTILDLSMMVYLKMINVMVMEL